MAGARVRLQKILAAGGVASRRAAEALIEAGRVTVNGRVARLGERADPERDRVAVDGTPVRAERHAYWLLHKPRGVLSTVRDRSGRTTVLDLLPAHVREGHRMFPVGRLDLDSEGLLLLTNDGEVAHALLHPSLGTEREYRVSVRGQPGEAVLERLARGVRLEDGVTAPARVSGVRRRRRNDTTELTLTLGEGRKRQIRRSLAALGHPVVRLVRRRMGPLRLGDLAAGEARPLGPGELRALRGHVRARGPGDRRGARRGAGQAREGADESPPGGSRRIERQARNCLISKGIPF